MPIARTHRAPLLALALGTLLALSWPAAAARAASATDGTISDPDAAVPEVAAAPAPAAKAEEAKEAKEKAPVLELCPVDRPRHYMDDFGDPRWGGGFHYHQGIDIFAPRGTPIRAPFDGKAVRSDSWAGGLGVYVYGRRGFVFNAHLTELGKLGKVHAGEVVGYVGNSGDAIGGSTHDHFEWHPGGGPAVDAFRLLNAACSAHPHPTSRPSATLR